MSIIQKKRKSNGRNISADYVFKVCLFGEGGVGKSSLTRRFLTGNFDFDMKLTMGVNIFVKHLKHENREIGLQIWDFGGEESYRFLLPSYSKGAAAGIFMFDITRLITLEKLDEWITRFKHGLSDSNIPIIMVGGKLDLEEERSAEKDYAEKLTKTRQLQGYIECSALSGRNVDYIFEFLIEKLTNK